MIAVSDHTGSIMSWKAFILNGWLNTLEKPVGSPVIPVVD